MKILDLRIGNPAYLASHYEEEVYVSFKSNDLLDYDLNPGHTDLKETIRKLHKVIGNAKTEGKHIVIGNGATQLLNAALSLSVPRGGNVLLRRPYWNRLPKILKQSGVRLASCEERVGQPRSVTPTQENSETYYSELIVSPNNPTNEIPTPSKSPNRIYDLSYNWPQYCQVTNFDEKVVIFSLTKSTGLAGTRIGWAIVADQKLAQEMEDFIDVTSGGVSRESQTRANLVLQNQLFKLDVGYESVFDYGLQTLSYRWERVLAAMKNSPLEILNKSGMFLWCQIGGKVAENDTLSASEKLLNDYGIAGICGEKCGGNRSQVRINIGCSDSDFEEFLRRISNA